MRVRAVAAIALLAVDRFRDGLFGFLRGQHRRTDQCDRIDDDLGDADVQHRLRVTLDSTSLVECGVDRRTILGRHRHRWSVTAGIGGPCRYRGPVEQDVAGLCRSAAHARE